MRCENKNDTMKINRFLSKPQVIPILIITIDVVIFLLFNYAVNCLSDIGLWINDKEHPEKYLALTQMLPRIFDHGTFVRGLYLILGAVLIVLDFLFAYQIRTSFSEKDINKGQEGVSRWTTIPEIKNQCKAIPLSKEYYEGKAGVIMAGIKDTLYINTDPINRIYLGTTRSGKDQMFVLPAIDVNSRAKKIMDRPSMIIQDPKLEAYRSSKAILEKRGYIVRLFNLYDPMRSMGYNPLQLVINHYKAGRVERAQMAAKTFAFSIFNADDNMQEPIWKNTATDLFTALIIAVTTDCIDADKKLNDERYKAFSKKQKAFFDLEEDDQRAIENTYADLKNSIGIDQDVCMIEDIQYIPGTESFGEIYPNEEKVNCFSVINFFKDLCGRALEESENKVGFEKKAETALDAYFNSRPKLDFAASLYATAKSAGARTKGSIYTNMQSAISVFSLYNIAQMTAESDFDIKELGYGDKPVAIFMAIPFEDRSNHFLATTFISQVCQYLSQLANTSNGKLNRQVRFILNECGNLPVIENLAGYITVGLGIGMYFELFVQSYNQIQEKYKEATKTIMENCANHVYIMSVGNESPEEFSKMLGTKTIIESQRSGRRFSTDKNYLETLKERPLMYPHELGLLKPGEAVIYRRMQRTDRLGVAIDSHPIIAEYKDRLGVIENVKLIVTMAYNRLIKKEVMLHPEDGYVTSWKEELKIRSNDRERYLGTSLLYAYQYLDDFPDAKSINYENICNESRAHIDFTKKIYDPEEVIKILKKQKRGKADEKKTKKSNIVFKEMKSYLQIKYRLISELGKNYLDELGISENDSVSTVCKAIMDNKSMENTVRQSIISIISKEV